MQTSIRATLLLVAACAALNNKGTEFVVSFLENDVEYFQSLPVELWVVNDNAAPASVTISAPRDSNAFRAECGLADTTQVVQGRTTALFQACWWTRLSVHDDMVTGKVLRLVSDQPIGVLGVNKDTFSADSFMVLPISSLGTNYYAVSYGYHRPDQVAVIGTRADTSVTLILPQNTGEGPEMTIDFRCRIYRAGESLTIQIHAYEVFHLQSDADITGLQIMASDPVAVFAGNGRTGVPITKPSRDHLVEQMISTGNWDRQFIYQPISRSNPTGDYVRIISRIDGAVVSWESSNSTSGTFTLNAGEWRQLHLTVVTYINGTVPDATATSNVISVFVITLSQVQINEPSDIPTDPTLLTLQGLNQEVNAYTVPAYRSAISTHIGTLPEKYEFNTLFVIARTGDTNGLLVDGGAPVFRRNWESVPTVDYQVAEIALDGEVEHTITHSSGQNFGAFFFSNSDRESMASPINMMAPAVCETRVMRHGDELDNDCDGQLDEELCNGIDDDEDGLIDEDCQASSGLARGRNYLVAFIDNSKSDAQPGDLRQLEIYISPQNEVSPTSVTFVGNGLQETQIATPGQTLRYEVSESFRMDPASGIYDKGISVTSSDDIVLYAINKIKFSSESYLGIPVDVTGFDYYVACASNVDPNDATEFAVCASAQGSTTVRITLGQYTSNVAFDGQQRKAGDVFEVALSQRQCLQLQDNDSGDLTGSRVQAFANRVSVFSGNRRPKVIGTLAEELTYGSRDHIVEQMPPVSSWGRQFFTNPVQRAGVDGATRGDVFRFISSQPGTSIQVVSNQGPVRTLTMTAAGEFQQLFVASNENLNVMSNNPILVVQITKTQVKNGDDLGDPAMSLVVPRESWSNNYRFVTPRSGQLVDVNNSTSGYRPYDNKVSIVINTEDIGNLVYNNQPFADQFNVDFVAIPNSNPPVSAATISVAFGQQSLMTSNDNVFSAVIYGAADREFYMNPISLRLGQQQCVLTIGTSIQGDGIDNDCDGEIDEEACNGLDDDRDGLVDEDCGLSPEPHDGRVIIAFMANEVEYPSDYPLNIYVYGTCPGTTTVRFQTDSSVYGKQCDTIAPIPENEYRQFSPSVYFRMDTSGRFKKAMYIDSTCSDIEVSAFNMDRFSNDGFYSIPQRNLGNEYYTVSYFPTNIGSQFAVVALTTTSVTITLPNNVNVGQVVNPVNNNTFGAGNAFSVPLTPFESIQIIADGDLSGTRIQSADNFLVWSGNVRAKIGTNSKSRDHLVEQIPPWSSASNSWNLVANGMTETEFVKMICSIGTQVNFPNGDGTSSQISFSNSMIRSVSVGQFYAARVTATGGNCQFYLFTESQTADGQRAFADPTMTYILPQSQYFNYAFFTTPKASDNQYNSTVVVVAESVSTSNIRLDGVSIPPSSWSSVQGSDYSVARVPVIKKDGQAANKIDSTDGSNFEARLWGVADRESFSYPLRIRF